MRLLDEDIDLRAVSTLSLSFVGDAVYDLLVREKLLCEANRPVGKLNEEKIKAVRCEAQAKAALKLTDMLSQEEADIFRRGKNAHTQTVPKHSSRQDYQLATGFEALFGYLYLKGETERLRELFRAACEE